MKVQILVAAIFLLLFGCSSNAVDSERWEHGKSLCENNGGIESYDRVTGDDKVVCKNGAFFNVQDWRDKHLETSD